MHTLEVSFLVRLGNLGNGKDAVRTICEFANRRAAISASQALASTERVLQIVTMLRATSLKQLMCTTRNSTLLGTPSFGRVAAVLRTGLRDRLPKKRPRG